MLQLLGPKVKVTAWPFDQGSSGCRHTVSVHPVLMMYCCRKVIKDDLEQRRRGSVKTPAVSRTIPYITPISSRTSPASAPSSAVTCRDLSAVKSQTSLPVCGDSFFENSEANESCSNWSFSKAGIELSSFDEIDMEPRDMPAMLSSSNNTVSSVQRSLMSTPQTSQTSQQQNATSAHNSLPSSDVKPRSMSSAAVTVAACSPPSGLTDMFCVVSCTFWEGKLTFACLLSPVHCLRYVRWNNCLSLSCYTYVLFSIGKI